MEKQTVKKISSISFMVAAIIVWISATTLLQTLAGSFGVVQRMYNSQIIHHGLPIILAVGLFAFLQFSPKILNLTEEVVLEISKIVWPSRKDVVGMTIVVVVMVFIASVLLLCADTVAREVVKLLVDLPTLLG